MADDLKISVQFRYFQYSPLLCRFYSINVFLNGVELFFRILSFFSFSGGAELLFNKVKDHEVVLPKNENPCESPPPPPPPTSFLLVYFPVDVDLENLVVHENYLFTTFSLFWSEKSPRIFIRKVKFRSRPEKMQHRVLTVVEMLPPRDQNDVEPCLPNITLVAFRKGARSHFKIPMSTPEGVSLRFWVGGLWSSEMGRYY